MGREGDSPADATDASETSDERSKGIAVCEDCDGVVSVWVRSDGTVDPISPQGVCDCDEPTLELVTEEELETETTDG